MNFKIRHTRFLEHMTYPSTLSTNIYGDYMLEWINEKYFRNDKCHV